MIVFDLSCDGGHRFEGWFGSSADFAEQQERALLSCPQCGSLEVDKAPMAPAVPRKGNRAPLPAARRGEQTVEPAAPSAPVMSGPLPPQVAEALKHLARAQAKALKKSRWVGERFAGEARAMHHGEREVAPIHGRATAEEAEDLLDEGIAIAPLPFPIVAPEELN